MEEVSNGFILSNILISFEWFHSFKASTGTEGVTSARFKLVGEIESNFLDFFFFELSELLEMIRKVVVWVA